MSLKLSEFACPCCGNNLIQTNTFTQLLKAREIAGVPFRINSGYRCEAHNREVGGTEDSSHIKGYAADLHCLYSGSRWKIIDALIKAGFVRIGIGKSFIHADNDPDKDQNVIWLY